MKTVQIVQSLEQLKILADARRMEILRLLMESPATLTQLAAALQQSPAWARHHILALQNAGLIEICETRRTGKVTEKFYRAIGAAFLLQRLALPKSKKPVVIFSGSHDLALEEISERLAKRLTLLSMPVGSLDGLVHLRQGLCQICGAHLLDESGEYNTPFVRRFFPDREVKVVTLAHRAQGLMFAAGNPKSIKTVADLARKEVRFANRNPGSGTRLWLDKELRRRNIPPRKIRGYESAITTHSEAARLVAQGGADAAIGLLAAANRYGLGFIPLFEERYDLILPRELEKTLLPLLDYLQTSAFRREMGALYGYDLRGSGAEVK